MATVLSTISGTPCAFATAARPARSATLPAGLPMLSQKIARVSASISAAMSSGLSLFANFTLMPCAGSMCANSV